MRESEGRRWNEQYQTTAHALRTKKKETYFNVFVLSSSMYARPKSRSSSEPDLKNAIQRGDTQSVETLIQADPRLVNNVMSDGEYALHVAAQTGNENMIYLLLKYGADLRALTPNSLRPVDYLPLDAAHTPLRCVLVVNTQPTAQFTQASPVLPTLNMSQSTPSPLSSTSLLSQIQDGGGTSHSPSQKDTSQRPTKSNLKASDDVHDLITARRPCFYSSGEDDDSNDESKGENKALLTPAQKDDNTQTGRRHPLPARRSSSESSKPSRTPISTLQQAGTVVFNLIRRFKSELDSENLQIVTLKPQDTTNEDWETSSDPNPEQTRKHVSLSEKRVNVATHVDSESLNVPEARTMFENVSNSRAGRQASQLRGSQSSEGVQEFRIFPKPSSVHPMQTRS